MSDRSIDRLIAVGGEKQTEAIGSEGEGNDSSSVGRGLLDGGVPRRCHMWIVTSM